MDEKQATTEFFELKHASALDKIRSAFAKTQNTDQTQNLQAELAQAQASNESLNQELEVLKAQRSRDVAELDTLIAQLKPLIGEA